MSPLWLFPSPRGSRRGRRVLDPTPIPASAETRRVLATNYQLDFDLIIHAYGDTPAAEALQQGASVFVFWLPTSVKHC